MSRISQWTSFFLFAVALLALAAVVIAAPEGKAVYESNCATCHGDDGKGETKAGKMLKTPDLLTAEWKQGTGQAEVEKMLLEGLGKMKGYEGKLSAEEITAVAEYTRQLADVE